MTEQKKVKAGLYLEETFYLKLRIWLMSQRPRAYFSEYAELAIREKYNRDTALQAKEEDPPEIKK